jgi:hypothetical protein
VAEQALRTPDLYEEFAAASFDGSDVDASLRRRAEISGVVSCALRAANLTARDEPTPRPWSWSA